MTPRERILAAIEFTGPDRCPLQHYVFPGAFWRHGQKLLDLMQRYPDDFGNEVIACNAGPPPPETEREDAILEHDPWGFVTRRRPGYTIGELVEAPLPTWDHWKTYQFPPLPPDSHFEEFAARAQAQHPERFVMGGSGASLFSLPMYLRGVENFYMDLAEDSEEVNELLDRLVDRSLYHVERYVAAGADCIVFGEDWGSQDRLLVHPDTWRKFYKPRYRRIFEVIRDAGAHVWFHTDGWMIEILDDWVEIGVSVLNPQHTIMNTRRVGEILGGRVCIRTDIDRQHLLPCGTPDEVRAAVKEAIESFGAFNGGCLLHGEVGPEVPFENIEAMYSAFYEYGRYPLDWIGQS